MARLNWGDYKRNIIGQLVDLLESQQGQYQPDLLRLMSEVAGIEDFSHLERLDDGKVKAELARKSVNALRVFTRAHSAFYDEQKKADERRQRAREELLRKTGIQNRLEELKQDYIELIGSQERQRRGYRLEQIIRDLFELFDLDARASFKVTGEQSDGAFTFDATDYLC